MILPMTKYDFVLYHADVDNFLQELQTLGIVDVRRQQKPIDEYSKALMEEIIRFKSVAKRLESFEDKDSETTPLNISEINIEDVEKLMAENDELNASIPKLEIEIAEAKPWGNWTKNDISKIQEAGFTLHFYCTAKNNFDTSWNTEFAIKELGESDGKIYFVILENDSNSFSFPLNETRFPRLPHDELVAQCEQMQARSEEIEEKLNQLSTKRQLLHDEHSEMTEELEVYLAGQSAQKEAADTLVILTAFSPKSQNKTVAEFLNEQSVVYISETAKPEDNPPISLKNNRFAKLFEPIGNMFMPPNYQEKDVTAYFAPFYMLFFGFCLGDVGYGIILLLAGTLGKIWLPKMKSLLSLVQWLGAGAIVMAMISGTFFGTSLANVLNMPEGGWDVGGHKVKFFVEIEMFWFAIIFGGVQILYAKVLQGIFKAQRFGWQYGMVHYGWAALLLGLGLLIGGIEIPSLLLYILLYGGLGLILFFTHISPNILKRFVKGLTSLYDITGLFGDILSYIRLFGLGASGGTLGMVVNTIGALIIVELPYVGWFIGIIFLVIGHIAVLALSSLGAFVHPMRLTFVEFYKNIGFEGGGKAFNPLKKHIKN